MQGFDWSKHMQRGQLEEFPQYHQTLTIDYPNSKECYSVSKIIYEYTHKESGGFAMFTGETIKAGEPLFWQTPEVHISPTKITVAWKRWSLDAHIIRRIA